MATLDNKINRARPSLLKKKPGEEVSPLSEIDKEEKVETELDDLDLEKKLLASMQTFSPEDERKKVQDTYKDKSNKADYLELADKLQQAVTRYAAASKGLKSGVDLSNIPIQGADWEKIRDRYLKDKQVDLADIEGREGKLASLLNKKQVQAKSPKIIRESYLVDSKGLPVYRIEGQAGYFDADNNPVPKEEVRQFTKPDKEKQERLVPLSGFVDPENELPVFKKGNQVVDAFDNPVTPIEKKQKLSPVEIKAIADFNNAEKTILDMFSIPGETKTGRWENVKNTVEGWVNLDDPKVTANRAKVVNNLNNYIKELTGAAMSEKEAQRIMSGAPTFNDKPETFSMKLQNTLDSVQRKKNEYLESLKAANKKVGQDSLPSTPSFPRKVTNRKTGESATVSNEEELREARQEGFE